MSDKLKNIYTSISCNRTVECADWGNNGLLLFGGSNAVCIMDPKFNGVSAKITHTYVRHDKRVITVRWLRSTPTAQEEYFLSGSDDGTAMLWHIGIDIAEPICYTLNGHVSGVCVVAGVARPCNEWLLATASADGTVRLWRFDGELCSDIQILALGGYCLTMRLVQLPHASPTNVLLAYGMDDGTIALFAQQTLGIDAGEEGENYAQFVMVHILMGHQDWVRGLDFVMDGKDLLLASGGQDHFIRLWRISPRTEQQVRENCANMVQVLEEPYREIHMEEKLLQLGESTFYAISLESVLYGHEHWVYSVHWNSSEEHGLRLLSASIDKTMVIWAPVEDGVWMEQMRVGEVGGNSVGFFGGKFASDGNSIVGHGYQGSFRLWNRSESDKNRWEPGVIVGGHYGEVRDLGWEPDGEFLITLSADQTTRIHAPWLRADQALETSTWHELARPQVHGYDMQALAILSRYKFASGGEEKIVRTFQTTANFIENFRRITRVQHDTDGDALLESLPEGASVPSLGLSNKAVYTVEEADTRAKHVKDEYPENYFVPVTLDMPPQEETLMQNTLWPEVQKLYGHGFEIYALAASPDGRLLASTCRATTTEHAQIILWNTATWQQVQKLIVHQLTVTQLRFSPDNRYLLAVSRDRHWSLLQSELSASGSNGVPTFKRVAATSRSNGIHTRIIWSCDWAHDSKYFATSSRDGLLVAWTHSPAEMTKDDAWLDPLNGWRSHAVLNLNNESITAVAFAPRTLTSGAYVMALGCESGLVQIYELDGKWKKVLHLNQDQAHHKTVRRLQFRPFKALAANQFHLASCGNDFLVRIYELNL